jgi:hypothetical protein
MAGINGTAKALVVAMALLTMAPAMGADPPADALATCRAMLDQSGCGPFCLWTSHDTGGRLPEYRAFPLRVWQGATRRVVDDSAQVTIAYEGCKLPGIEGDFDFSVHLRAVDDRSVDLDTVITNRLQVGIGLARVVLRCPSQLVAADDNSYLYFAFDDWVRNPVKHLASAALVKEDPASALGFRWDDAERGFYRQFQNGRPVLSVHRPGWGWMLHDLDPNNGASGCLLAGSNDGALEIGYEYHLPGELRAGNGVSGPMRLAPTLRATLLPGVRPADTGWWETVDAYRAFAIEHGLLNAKRLVEKPVPSRWAQESVFMVFNIGAGTDGMTPGTATPASAIVQPWLDYLDRAITFYKQSGQRHFAVMLWGWSAIGPYQPISGVDKVLAGFANLAIKHDVAIHPGIYMLPTYLGKAALGTPLEAALNRDLRGNPHRWGPDDDLFSVDPGHPLFVGEIKRALSAMMDRGVQWVYFDNPYYQVAPDLERGGIVLEHGAATRALIAEVPAMMEQRGGGFICCERYRVGLESAYGVVHDLGLPGDENVPFTEALVHDLYTTGSFGDMVGSTWEYMAADPAYGLGGDVPNAARLAHRLGVVGAAYGRTCIDGHFGSDLGFFEAGTRPEAHYQLLGEVTTLSVLNGLRARLAHEALRTGRMLPPPPSDGGRIELAKRRMKADGTWTPTLRGWAQRFPAAFFASQERPGWHTLAVANPEDQPARVTFRLTPVDYPTMAGSTGWQIHEAANEGSTLRAADTAEIVVTVAPHDVAVVDFEPLSGTGLPRNN